jgi:hypothetical protein
MFITRIEKRQKLSHLALILSKKMGDELSTQVDYKTPHQCSDKHQTARCLICSTMARKPLPREGLRCANNPS